MKTLFCAALFAFASCGPYHEPPSPNALDADGDGISDAADLCPESAETPNGYLDGDGCPDSSTVHGPFPPSLVGRWRGSLTLTVVGVAFAAQHDLMIALDGDGLGATMSGLCQDGSGAVHVDWVDEQAAWYGIYVCPRAPWDMCPSAGLIMFGVRGHLLSDGSIEVVGTGTARMSGIDGASPPQCDVAGELTWSFSGVRE